MSTLPAALVLTLFCVVLMLVGVQCHGRLWEPPSRSSMWRRGYLTPVNYQDNELFCGGFYIQYEKNGGKCGICGDPYDGVREHETGGKYATGLIVRNYDVGQVMSATVQLTAHHKGYFEFNICPRNDLQTKISEECLAKYPLVELSSGQSRYNIPPQNPKSNYMKVQLRLPTNVRCRACVFRWKYNAGNSWGTFPNGTSCIGCGEQEQFYGCADIAIGYRDVTIAVPAENEQNLRFAYINETSSQSRATNHLLQGNIFSMYLLTILHLITNN